MAICSSVIALVTFIFCWFVFEDEIGGKTHLISLKKRRLYRICTILIVIIVGVGSYFGITHKLSTDYQAQLTSYNEQKIMIENSLKDDNLTEVERLEKFQQAYELNKKLTENKSDINSLNYFNIYVWVRENYNKAEFINLAPFIKQN